MAAGRPKNKKGETRAETLNRLGIVELKDNYGHQSFRTANKEAHTAPKILKRYKEDGVRMYKCEGGRIFLADKYDQMFKPAAKFRQIKNKAFKGEQGFYKL